MLSRKYAGFLFALMLYSIAQHAYSETRGVGIRTASGDKIRGYKASYALVIGVSDYTNGWPDLNEIPKELDKVESALYANGFDKVIRVKNPDSRALKAAFDKFLSDYGYNEDNRLLVFFSGHGYTRKGNSKGYLVPTNAPNPHKDERGFLRKAFTMSDVLHWARKIESRHVLFLFDSCFSGTVFKSRALPKQPPSITAYMTKPVRQFITAGSANEEVPAKSVFTPMFIRALRGAGDLNNDGYITGSELGMYIRDKVSIYNVKQTPQYGKIRDAALDEGDFVFVLANHPNQVSIAPAQIAQVSAPAQMTMSGEHSMWQLVRNSKDIDELQLFIAQFPKSYFVALANKRIKLLENQNQNLNQVLANASTNESPTTKHPLYINTSPSNAKIRILNITPKYNHGIKLKTGSYHIEASKTGYVTQKRWVDIANKSANFYIALKKQSTPAPPVPRVTQSQPQHQSPSQDQTYTVGNTTFTMKAIPAGSFSMGCVSGKKCQSDEKPVHKVTLKAFSMMETEVTFALWDACVTAGGCSYKSKDRGWGRGNRPVIYVSYNDITEEFIPWLNQVTGKDFSLPSEAQWEYTARADTKTQYSWGDSVDCSKAQYNGGKSSSCYYKSNGDYRGTAPVKSFNPNNFGLYDMRGNVWEWIQDCWNSSYNGAPANGDAWLGGRCSQRVLRGGSWSSDATYLRAASRSYDRRDVRLSSSGFRLARTY